MEIGFYFGRTAHLVDQYLALIRQAEADGQQRKRLIAIKSQLRHLDQAYFSFQDVIIPIVCAKH